MYKATPLTLASSSPRRAQLLRDAGYVFEIVPPPDAEPAALTENARPVEHAEGLSRFKADSTRTIVETGVILAADTVAVLNGCIFGKPLDRDDARRTLKKLTAATHDVITGITLLDVVSGKTQTTHDRTRVSMKLLSDEEMEAYLDSGAWIGKAGAYGLQDKSDPFVTHIEGSFTNVVGLPMELLKPLLRDWHIPLP